jgi:O-antigen/teichoic acid export membrane protein
MSIFGYLRSRLENFAIIALFGVKGNGLYSIAQEIAFLPMTELVQPIQRGFYSTAAKLKASKEQMFELYAKQSNWVLLILVPCFFGLLAVQDLFTQVVLGVNWLEAGSIMPIFTATTIPLSLYLLVIYILTIDNKFKYIIAIDVAYSIILAFITYMIDHFNLLYFTTFRACLSFLVFGYYLLVIKIHYRVNLLFLLKSLPAVTFSAVCMYVLVLFIRTQLTELPQLIQLLILIFSGILTYLVVLYWCCRLTSKGNQRVIEILDIYNVTASWLFIKFKTKSITKDRDQID